MTTRDQSTGGLCTYALRLSSGAYVQDPDIRDNISFHIDWAYAWFSEERALEVAKATPWIGESAAAVRIR
jgi:hypothetical protein